MIDRNFPSSMTSLYGLERNHNQSNNTAKDVAGLVNATTSTVTNREKNRTHPRLSLYFSCTVIFPDFVSIVSRPVPAPTFPTAYSDELSAFTFTGSVVLTFPYSAVISTLPENPCGMPTVTEPY